MSIFSKPENSKYLFIDMNSYFASCEQQVHSFYRGQPVAVTPVNTANGCIVSASYEAKAFGIKTGTLVKDAKIMCPSIIVCESDTYLYLDFHKKWVKVVKNFSPFVSVKSVDEAVIMLSPSERNTEKAYLTAIKIKDAIRCQVGECLRSSIGIGPNIFLAKQGSDYQKPDGLFEIKIENLREYYRKIKLTDIKGINFRMEKQLQNRGFFCPIDLYNAPVERLRRQLGVVGEYWHCKLHGFDLHDQEFSISKTIGHSHVLEPKFRNWVCAWAVCQKLIEKAGYRLRQESLQASGVFLGVRFLSSLSAFSRLHSGQVRHRKSNNLHGWQKGIKTQTFSDSFTFINSVSNLWEQIPKREFLPLKIAVTLFHLTRPLNRQGQLFRSCEREENLSFASDLINNKYGAFTIKPANVLLVGDSAPDRISFGRPI